MLQGGYVPKCTLPSHPLFSAELQKTMPERVIAHERATLQHGVLRKFTENSGQEGNAAITVQL